MPNSGDREYRPKHIAIHDGLSATPMCSVCGPVANCDECGDIECQHERSPKTLIAVDESVQSASWWGNPTDPDVALWHRGRCTGLGCRCGSYVNPSAVHLDVIAEAELEASVFQLANALADDHAMGALRLAEQHVRWADDWMWEHLEAMGGEGYSQ